MDDLAQSWNWLTLSKREGLGYSLTNDNSVIDFSITAKFLTKKAINIDVS